MRNLILSAVLAGVSLFGLSAQAESIQAGKQYVELASPVPVSKPGQIEVVELFWYGCPHCYQFEATINPCRGGKLEEGMPACTGCHSPNGAGLDMAGFPQLGGQHAGYVAKQLTDFREGNRSNDGDSMIMRAIAAKLSNKDIEAVSSYIQGLH